MSKSPCAHAVANPVDGAGGRREDGLRSSCGNGNVTAVDGNKLTIAFDKAGEKWW
jgi:hypothetical protein